MGREHMLAVKIKGFDIAEGREFKFFFIVDPDSGDFRQLARERLNTTDEDPDINELRFRTGIKDIYGIVDMGSWNNYWGHRHQLIELNKELSNDPDVLKSIADYKKEQKATCIKLAANKWNN